MPRSVYVWAGTVALLLSGCSSLAVPQLALPQSWNLGGTQAGVTPNAAWWEGLQNPALSNLISQSLVLSPDVAQAAARVKAAQGLQLQVSSRLWPSADAVAGVRETAGDNTGLVRSAGLEAAWELDLFGGNRATARSARAERRAAEAAVDLTRVSLVAAVARTYGTLWAQQQAVQAARLSQAAAQEEFRIVRARAQAGLVQPLALARNAEQQADAAAQLARAEQAAAETARALAVLSGLPLAEIQAFIPADSTTIPLLRPLSTSLVLATPLEVIQQRPDVRVARAQLEARIADTAAARALRWPTLTLGSVLGISGWANTPRSVAATAALPILNFGAIRGAIRTADAEAEAALIGYQAAVHAALSEVETRILQLEAATRQLTQQQQAFESAQEAERLVRVRTQAGLEAATALPQVAYATQTATVAYANAQADYLVAYANLFTAVAGAAN